MSSPPFDNVPPRTWQRWWNDLPGWFRIGCCAALAGIIVQFAITLRIAIGLIEPSEISALRRTGAQIIYQSDRYSDIGQVLVRLQVGLRGLSCEDVVEIRFKQHGADDLLKQLGTRFSKLEHIDLSRSDVTAAGLNALTAFPSLRTIKICNTEITDADLACLLNITSLIDLSLSGTLITDTAIPVLQRVPKLTRVDLAFTDVSLSAIRASRTQRTDLLIFTEKDCAAESLLGTIRWADARRSRWFAGDFQMGISSVGKNSRDTSVGRNLGESTQLWWSLNHFANYGEGDFELTLRLGDFDAEPVLVHLTDGKFSVNSVEFRMPVTMDKALRVPQDLKP